MGKPVDLVTAAPRFKAARRHIEAVDEAIRPYRPAVAVILREDRRRRVELKEVDRPTKLCQVDPAYVPAVPAPDVPAEPAVAQPVGVLAASTDAIACGSAPPATAPSCAGTVTPGAPTGDALVEPRRSFASSGQPAG